MTQRRPLTWLFNPFIYLAGGKALVLGLLAVPVASLIGAWSNTHFDGVLDTHTGASAPLWIFVAEGLIDWACLSLVLLLAGRLISRTAFRSIDVLGTQALARWPSVFIAIVASAPVLPRFASEVMQQVERVHQGGRLQINVADAALAVIVVLAMFVFLCWMVMLMYRAFSVSCNVKGGKGIGMFIASLLIAEVLSKVAVLLIFRQFVEPR